MTRINSGIKPSELCDQHLVAEYREIGRLGVLLEKRRLKNGQVNLKGQPQDFTFGGGHMLFFLDKGEYVKNRFEGLKQEMKDRGMKPKMEWRDHWKNYPQLDNDWTPPDKTRKLVQKRITFKMPPKPRWSQRKKM